METLYTHDILYCSRGISIHWTNISVPHQASNMKVRIIIVALLQHRCVQNDSGPRWIKILFNSQISNISESSVCQTKHNRKRNKEWTFLLASFVKSREKQRMADWGLEAKRCFSSISSMLQWLSIYIIKYLFMNSVFLSVKIGVD